MNFEQILLNLFPNKKHFLTQIKNLNNSQFLHPRSGWVIAQVKNKESNFEHTLKLALATYYFFGENEDLVDLALCHDLPEIHMKDYIPGEIPEEEKKEKELKAARLTCFQLNDGAFWFNQILKYTQKKIPETKIIWELDKLCPAIQALNYWNQNECHPKLDEFYISAKRKIQTPELINMLEQMYSISFPISINAYEIYFNMLKKIK